MTRLLIKDLFVAREKNILIKEFSHQFEPGCIYAVVGNNGVGKTTFLKTLAGLTTPSSGNIFFEQVNLLTLNERDRAKIISFLLQDPPNQTYCTTLNRIAHGLMPTIGYDAFLDEHATSLIDEVAQRLNVHHLLSRRLHTLSGGEQRLVHLAKCLVNPHTKIVLLDEPSAFLDFSQQNNLGKNLKAHAQRGQIIIFSSHDAAFIKRYSDCVIEIVNQQATAAHSSQTLFF